MSRIIVLTARVLLALIVVATAYAGRAEPDANPGQQTAVESVVETRSS